MMLLDNNEVKGYSQRISISFPLDSEDQSGSHDRTDALHLGYKAAEIRVSMQIKFDEARQLGALKKIFFNASKGPGQGDPRKWLITHAGINQLGIHTVQFCSALNVRESAELQLWEVDFALRECEADRDLDKSVNQTEGNQSEPLTVARQDYIESGT